MNYVHITLGYKGKGKIRVELDPRDVVAGMTFIRDRVIGYISKNEYRAILKKHTIVNAWNGERWVRVKG